MNIKKVLSTLTLGGVLAASIAGAGVLAAEATDTVKTTPLGTYKKLVEGKTVLLFKLAQEGDVISVSDVENAFPGKTVIASENQLGTGDEVTIEGATYTIVVYGDANGDGVINTGDAVIVKRAAAELTELTDVQKVALELNGDEKVNTGDAIRIQRVAAGDLAVENIVDKQIPAKEGVSVDKVEIATDGKTLTVTLSDAVENAKFYLNGKLVEPTKTEENVYTFTVALENGKEYTFKVTDKTASFEQTKTFIYRELAAPFDITIAATETNDFADVNAGNVNNATVLVTFGTINGIAETLEVTIKDENDKEIKLSKELTGFETEVRIDNVDLSSLAEGDLELTAVIKDDQGNVSEETTSTVLKKADAPIVKYTTVTRDSATKATVEVVKSTDSDVVYYMVKEAGEAAPTAEQVIAEKEELVAGQQNVTIEDGDADKAYVVYLVPVTATGTYTETLVTVPVSKVNAEAIAEVTGLAKKTGTEATFVWAYDETTKGFVEYKAVLKKDGKSVAEKTVAKGAEKEVDFFAEMKKEAGKYTVEVIAVADNVDYANSVAVVSEAVVVEGIATSVDVKFDTDVKTLLKWEINPTDNITKVSDYTVEVAKYNAKDKKFEVVATSNTTSTSFDIAEIVKENGIGEYKARVIANAKAEALIVSTPSVEEIADSTIVYYTAEAINNLAVSKVEGQKVTLTATVLDDVYSSTTPEYRLYMKKAGETYPTSYEKVAEFPYEVDGLDAGTEYCFKLVTVVNGTEYVSNEITATTEGAALSTVELTYVEYEALSAVETLADLTAAQVTYNGETLYINNDGTTVAYTDAVAESIIDMLKQINLGDQLTITDNEISTLTVTVPEKTTTLDLTDLDKKAEVTVTGKADYKTTVKGTLNEITLNGEAAQFDLTGLTVSNAVNVSGDEVVLTAAADTKLTLAGTTATVNGVVLTSDAALGDVTVTATGFELVGTANTLTVDATKANKDVTVSFIATAQTGKLSVLSSEKYAVKVTTSTIKANEIAILGGKVDLTDARTSFDTITAGDAEEAKVILVTDKAAKETAIDEKVPAEATALIEESSFKFSAAEDAATYTVNEGSNEVILTIVAGESVTIEK